MLYLTNTIVSPSTYSLQSQINENTHFKFRLKDDEIYKWVFNRSLNEYGNDRIIDFNNDNLIIKINGLFENINKLYLNFCLDIRMEFKNSYDFSIATTKFRSTSKHNIVDQKVKLHSHVKNFAFMPYKDTIYVLLSVNNKLETNNDKPIDIVFDNFGFDLLETIS